MSRWLALALVVVLTGCAESAPDGESADNAATDSSTTSPSPTPSAEPVPTRSPKPRRGTEITTGPSDYGAMLFDARGQAIYLFDTETTSTPECYGACAAAWPPVITKGEADPGGDARGRLLGTTQRRDGSLQVTYDSHPLYFYAHEEPGQVLCHDIEEFGGLWLVVTPAGDAAPH